MSKFAYSVFIIFCSLNSFGQILTFEFSGLSGSETSATSNFNNLNINSSSISRGTGLNPSNNAERFNATNWAVTSISNAISGNDYMEFTISPSSGFSFSVSSIEFNFQRSATGPSAVALRSSVDNYNSNLDQEYSITDNTSTQTITFSFTQSYSSSSITYRLYAYAEGTSGSGGIGDGTGNDINVNGNVISNTTVNNPSNFSATSISSTEINLAATANSNSNDVLVAYNSSNVFGNPTGTYTLGNSISGGGTVHYIGTAGSLSSHSGLAPNTEYFYKIWSFDSTNYSSGLTANATTDCITADNVLNFSASYGNQTVDLSWNSPSCFDEVIIVGKESNSIGNSPSGDGSGYTSNSVFGLGIDIGNSEFIVFQGTINTVSISSLNNGTNYFFKSFTRKGVDWSSGVELNITPQIDGWSITAIDAVNNINFENTILGVINGTFVANGLSPSPIPGQLDSDAWEIEGMSDGNTNFGSTYNTGDFSNGQSTGQSASGGLYAFEISSGNIALGIQPIGNDFTPGSIILKIANSTGNTISNLSIAYKTYILNDQDRSNSFNFSYSTDNSNYTSVPNLNLSSTELTDVSAVWKGFGYVTNISGLNILNDQVFYLKWSGDDISGSGNRDEFALDDISIVLNPSINNANVFGDFEDLTLNGNAILTTTTTINSNLNLINGKLNIKDHNLILNGSFSNNTSSNYIVAEGLGFVKQFINQNEIKVYPIGTSNYYLPITIEQFGSADTLNIHLEEDVYNAGSSGPVQSSDVLDATWKITEKTAGGSRVNLTVEWPSSAELSGFDPTSCFFSHYRNGNWYPGLALDVSATDPRTITLNNVTSFSPFAIGSGSSPLPVDILKFDAKFKENIIKFSWSTLSEINSKSFEIYQLHDDSLTFLGELPSFGNSNFRNDYELDLSFSKIKPDAIFELIEVSKNGKKEHLAYTKLSTNPEIDLNYYFSEGNLVLEGNSIINKQVKLIDALGRVFFESKISEPFTSIQIDKKGIYFLIVADEYSNKTIKLFY